MTDIAWAIAAVFVALLAYSFGKDALYAIREVSAEWSKAFRYYTDGRAGLLSPPEPDDAPPAVAAHAEEADLIFNAWHDSVVFPSEEEATYVRQQWETARGHRAASKGERADALRMLRIHGAPLPRGDT